MQREYTVAHLFCGIGGGALGFQAARNGFRGLHGQFRTLCGIDVDSAGCEDFRRLAGAPAARMDLFSREDYTAFHGHQPPADWHEVTPDDIRAAAGGEYPDVVFTSPPCKGFSGLLPRASSESAKYQALNRLTFRGVWLALEAWRDHLPGLVLLENVPRITIRGKALLHDIKRLLAAYGYLTSESTHDCGEVGGLGQHRRRYLLVARQPDRIPMFVYQPPKRKLLSIGDVIGPMPLPDDPACGPMHRLPRLQWRTWVRLALIPAGGDWRDLQRMDISRYRIEPRDGRHTMQYRMQGWDETAATVTGITDVQAGAQLVADPRHASMGDHANKYRVEAWGLPGHTVTGNDRLGSGAPSIADPRLGHTPRKGASHVQRWDEPSGTITGDPSHRKAGGNGVIADPRLSHFPREGSHQVAGWDKPAATVTGSASVTGSNGVGAIADPRLKGPHFNDVERVTEWDKPAGTVAGGSRPSQGAITVADPRLGCVCRNGAYKVLRWDEPAYSVTGSGDVHGQGAASVADPRIPADSDRGVWVIEAEDGTWHRPLTTLELAALQGFPLTMPDGSPLRLVGQSDASWRERIGNAVPPPAAQAIAGQVLKALLMSEAGVWEASATPVWVNPPAGEVEPGADRPDHPVSTPGSGAA